MPCVAHGRNQATTSLSRNLVSKITQISDCEFIMLDVACGAVRNFRYWADEPRQALIGATVVCPSLPEFSGSTLQFSIALLEYSFNSTLSA